MTNLNKGFLFSWFGGRIGCVVLLGFIGYLVSEHFPWWLSAIVSLHAVAAFVFSIVMLYVCFCRLWGVIHPLGARATSGEAVLYMFVPIYNMYWIFQLWWGWARDFNTIVKRSGLSIKPMPEILALSVPILFLLSIYLAGFCQSRLYIDEVSITDARGLIIICLFFAVLFQLILNLVLIPVFMSKACTRANTLVEMLARQKDINPESVPLVASRSGYAAGSLVLGALGVITAGLAGMAGLILGIVTLGRIERNVRESKSHRLATTGVLVSGVSIVIGLLLAMVLAGRLALYDSDWRVRNVAVMKLTDQALLAKVAVEDENSSVRYSATEKLTDQALLAKVAVEDENSSVRYSATEKLTDQAAWARVAIEGKSKYDQLEAIRKLTDQTILVKILAKVAVEDRDSEVREAAAFRILRETILTDQAVLAKIAVEASRWDICDLASKAVAEKLTDQTLLAKVAIESKSSDVCYVAVSKLTDQTLLAKVAVEANDTRTRTKAVYEVKDQVVLAKVVVEDKDQGVRRSAVLQFTDTAMTDHNALARVVTEAKDWIIYPDTCRQLSRAVANKLTDQALLAKVAVEGNDWMVRNAAVEKLIDQALLEKVAVEDNDWKVRQKAVRKLTDQTLLAKVASEDKSPDVRSTAQSVLESFRAK